jgi:hypothetical protein
VQRRTGIARHCAGAGQAIGVLYGQPTGTNAKAGGCRDETICYLDIRYERSRTMADKKSPPKPATKVKKPVTAKVPPRPSVARAAAAGTPRPSAPIKSGASRKAATASVSTREVKQNFAATRDSVSKLATEKAAQLKADAARMTEDAGSRAKVMAREGKDKAAGAIASLAKYIDDSASSVDDRLGDQYGEYARTAAASIASLAATVEKQDVDELIDSTREFVRKSPAIAIGGAAVVGFIMARMLRGGSSDA